MTGSPAEDHYHRKTLAREDYPAPWSRGGIRDLETEGERMGGWGGGEKQIPPPHTRMQETRDVSHPH